MDKPDIDYDMCDIEAEPSDNSDEIEIRINVVHMRYSVFFNLTMMQAQSLANQLQELIDDKCQGKSPELYDTEAAAHAAAVDQWNTAQRIEGIARVLKDQADRLSHS